MCPLAWSWAELVEVSEPKVTVDESGGLGGPVWDGGPPWLHIPPCELLKLEAMTEQSPSNFWFKCSTSGSLFPVSVHGIL